MLLKSSSLRIPEVKSKLRAQWIFLQDLIDPFFYRITISFNVNHTVDAEGEDEPEISPEQDKPEFGEMKSKPTFEVDIKRGNKTLSFTCSFLQGDAQEGEYNDVFGIDQLTIFEGEHTEKVYAGIYYFFFKLIIYILCY